MNLSGLSATYPGYQASQAADAKTAGTRADTESTMAETQANQTKQRDAAIKMLGANVLGATLSGGNGPQAPPPGQASVPSAPPQMAAGAPPAGPAPPPAAGPAPPPAAQAGGVPGKLGLQPMIAQILKTTPGVANHPEVLLAALQHAKDLGLLDPEAEARIDEVSKQHTAQRISTAKGHLKAVQEGASADAAAPGPAAAEAPPLTALKPNMVTTFANGQKWTVGPDGQPKQVM